MKNQKVVPVVFLTGRRVYMRPPEESDIPHFLRWMNDPHVREFLKRFSPVTEGEEKEWLESLRKKRTENLVLVIVDRKTNMPIGTMGLHRIDWKDRHATSGAVIGEKKYWGKGYGSEAKMLLLHHAFNTMNLHKICSSVYGFNARSQAYNKKCGYKVEGVLRAHAFKNGAYVDQVLMAVFREDFMPIWKRFEKSGRV